MSRKSPLTRRDPRKVTKMTDKQIFSPSDILLPSFDSSSEDFKKWAVIACDQFTSDVSYWERVEAFVGSAPSTYDYILPEAYLETPREAAKVCAFEDKMKNVKTSPLFTSSALNGFIFIERTLSDGAVRRGILGKVDLESYDYSPDSTSPIRATEQTVPERIPPRSALRAKAAIELPHAMVFVDDRIGVFGKAMELIPRGKVVYDFDLMEGGGHIKGIYFSGDVAEKLSEIIRANEKAVPLPYAVGDGNHSLAAAKSLYDSVKARLGEAALNHPARYALCEIISISDAAVVFEPIHRIVKNVDVKNFLSELNAVTAEGDGGQDIRVITSSFEGVRHFTDISHDMTVGTLQNFIDEYIASHEGVLCDYIHGEEELRILASDEKSVAFMFDGFDKSKLFEFIKNGPMPRKTFSMGDARSKRYYLEARMIVES